MICRSDEATASSFCNSFQSSFFIFCGNISLRQDRVDTYDMENWKTKTIASDATLYDWVLASMHTQGWGRVRRLIMDFFQNQQYVSVTEDVGPYQHNTAQVVMQKYFETNLGYKKIMERDPESESSESMAVMEDVEVDFNSTRQIYRDAAIGYQTPKGEHVLVIIDRREEMEINYRVLSPPHLSGTLKGWFEFAKKENFYKGKKINATCNFLALNDLTWDEVILPVGIKNILQKIVHGAIKNQDLYRLNGLPMKRGVLMVSKPGMGKTSIVKVLAKEVPCTVIYAQPSHLYTPKDVRKVCAMAKDLSPCLLIIEDIDWIAESRDTGDAGRVIELMNQLDGLEDFTDVITIATTNELDKIEGAIKNRPGRFDRVITIENPDKECRERMVRLFTKKWKLDTDVRMEKIVGFTDGLSGAHMMDLCRTAASFALDEESFGEDKILVIKDSHFVSAVKEVKDKDYSTAMRSKQARKKIGFEDYSDDDDY